MDVTPSAGSLSIIMPPANEVSVGETTLFFNPGGFTFTVKDNGGNTIVAIAPGLSYQVYLIGNATVNGTWRSTQYAAGTSSATAGSLVGAGIKAINTTLNQSMSVTTVNSNYSIGDADRSEAFVWTGGAGALTLPASGTVGNDWFCHIRNGGTGAITLTPTGSELINGAPNLTFNPGDSAIVICDGASFFTIGFGQSVAFAFDYVSIDLSSPVTSPYTLSGANLNRIAYSFGGTLTANMQVLIPATIQQYWISNDTSGAFSLTVKVAGQIGVVIPQGSRGIYYCNGTDIIDADTASFAFPLTVAQGGTGATTESGARINLGGTSVGIGVFTAVTAADGRNALSAAKSGANSDITSLTGLTTPLSVGQGGTGTATAFTAGSVVFAGASGVYSQDNANLFWDDTNNRLGIGTATPTGRLDVVGFAYTGSDANNSFFVNSTSSLVTIGAAGRTSFSTSDLAFITSNGSASVERMRIDSAGNVGIGTVSPSAYGKFAVVGSGDIANFDTPSGATGIALFENGQGRARIRTLDGVNGLGFFYGSTEGMRLNNAGNVGIGTSAPGARLEVSGSFTTSADTFSFVTLGRFDAGYPWAIIRPGTTATGIEFRNSTGDQVLSMVSSSKNVGIGTSSPSGRLHIDGNFIRIDQSGANLAFFGNAADLITGAPAGAGIRFDGTALRIAASSSEIAQFTSGGNLGIGTNNPTEKLVVASNTGTSGLETGIGLTNTVDSNLFLRVSGSASTDKKAVIGPDTSTAFVFNTAGTERMRIDAAGNVGIGTTIPSSYGKLAVRGNINASTDGATLLTMRANANATDLSAYNATGAYLAFQTTPNGGGELERMRITADGNVGIGTNAPASTLAVNTASGVAPANTSGANALRLTSTATAAVGVGPSILFEGQTGNTTANYGFAGIQGFKEVATLNNYGGVLAFYTQGGGGASALTEHMRITSAGNVGIGTTTPESPLQVQARFRVQNDGVVRWGSDVRAGLYNESGYLTWNTGRVTVGYEGTGAVTFETTGTERMRITSAGLVGIGTTTPQRILGIGGTTSAYMNFNPTSHRQFTVGSDANGFIIFDDVTAFYRQVIDTSGNVGFNLNAPSYPMEVRADAASSASYIGITNTTATGGSGAAGYLARAGSNFAYFYVRGDGTAYIDNATANPLGFATNGTERARIDNNGNLLVGTTDPGPSSGEGVKLLPSGRVYSVITSSVADSYDLYNTTAAAYRFYVNNAGTIFATSTSITAISDIRLKENVRELDAGLDTILALKPRRFDWKQGKGKDVRDDMGFIAQEVEEVLPELIGGWKAGEGEPDDLKSVKAGDLIPVLVKAIQELTARVAQLEERK
jgi:hypothetical protein